MGVWETLDRVIPGKRRAAGDPIPVLTVSGWEDLVNYAGHGYALTGGQVVKGNIEVPDIAGDFSSLAMQAYKSNPVVFACMRTRSALFCEARFKYRKLVAGRPADLWGDSSLSILETPWPNGTTGDLLARMEQDASLSGNFYARVASRGTELQRMRPDWVNILLGSQTDQANASTQLDAEILGYSYYPGGPNSPGAADRAIMLDVSEVVHYAPTPDPLARFRGMSWLTPVIREIMGDTGYTDHKLKFLENGAVTNLFMVLDKTVSADNARKFEQWWREKNENKADRWKTLFVGGGATPMPVGASFVEMDFKSVQGGGETRIAAAAGTPPAVVGLSEGLQGASLNAGNFDSAMRLFTDVTIRELWRKAAGALAVAVRVPSGNELWYDDRDIPALREDIAKAGERMSLDATAISVLWNAGFDPDAIVSAVTSGDLDRLTGNHSGLDPVQAHQAGPPTVPATNGKPAAPALTP